jgi:hypothetical protein
MSLSDQVCGWVQEAKAQAVSNDGIKLISNLAQV